MNKENKEKLAKYYDSIGQPIKIDCDFNCSYCEKSEIVPCEKCYKCLGRANDTSRFKPKVNKYLDYIPYDDGE